MRALADIEPTSTPTFQAHFEMKDDGGIIRKEELFCAIVCSLYCCAGVALFVTGKAPVITESTDFFGDTFAYVWAGW